MAKPAVLTMIDGATEPIVSNTFVNNISDVLTLQITGTFSSATVLVEGLVNVQTNAWTVLAAFNLTDLSLKTGDGMEEEGVYRVSVAGILKVRIRVSAITGGNITVAANFVGSTVSNQAAAYHPSPLEPITAYDLAVLGGYTGTLEEFETDMGNSAANAAIAAESAASVSASAAQIAINQRNIERFNAFDIWDGMLTRSNGTSHKVVYTWSGDVCTVTTPNGASDDYSANVIRSSAAFPSSVVPGETYYVRYKTTLGGADGVRLRVIFRDASDTTLSTTYFSEDGSITVPVGASKWTAALYVGSGVTLTNPVTVSDIHFLSAKTNRELGTDTASLLNTLNSVSSDVDTLKTTSFLNRGVLANNTDLNTVKTEGHYVLAATRTYVNCPYPSPSSNGGMLEVLRYSDSIVFQRVTFATTQKIYKRAALDGTFSSAWKGEFQSEGSLPSGTDLDDVKDEGHYLLYSGYTYANAPFVTPVNYFCTLEVFHTTNNTVLQRISNTKTGTIYYRQSLLGSFSDPWVEINGTVNQKYVFDDLDASKYLAFRTAMYVSESSLSGYSCKLIPVKKGTTARIRTATRYPICPYGKVKYNYLLDYKAPFVNETDITYIDETVTFDYDGFIALNCMSGYHNYLLVELSYSTQADAVKDNLFVDAPENPYNFIPEYDPDNPCKYLKRGPSLMGAIHHWGIIGASYDSGEFNFTRPGATISQLSSLDYYEYSWGSALKAMNGIKDMYHYSNGGQNSKQWITLTGNIETDGTGRGFSYPDGVETVSQSWNGGLSTVSGIGPGGGCWWKVKEDVAQGRGKQAYVIVLGSNDINNNNPHDSSWNELTTYDETLYYKAGTTADIGTYDLSTDTDTVPAGKTAGVVPGIVNSYAAYMGAILNRLIALQPDCVIFLATIRNNFAWNENSIAIWNQYNDVLRDMAEMPQFADNVYLIDFAEYGPNYMQTDMRSFNVGYHPNAIGYHEVAYYYGTLIDYAIRNNFERLKLSQFIGTGKTYDPA